MVYFFIVILLSFYKTARFPRRVSRSFLHGAERHALREVRLDKRVDDDNGERRADDRRHAQRHGRRQREAEAGRAVAHLIHKALVRQHPVQHPRERLQLRLVADEHHVAVIVVPVDDRDKQRHSRDHAARERHDDAEENADLVAAVDHGGVLQLTGDGEGEIVPHDDEIGDIQRAGQDHDPEVPGQVERFVEHILRDEAAGKEQVEDHKRVDELHAADVDLADGVGHGGRDQHGKRGRQNRLDGGDEQAVCVDLGAEDLNIVLQIDALEPEHQTALDVFLIRHDRCDQAVPERVKAQQAERDAEDRHGHVVEVKAQPHEHTAAQGSGFLFHARPSL